MNTLTALYRRFDGNYASLTRQRYPDRGEEEEHNSRYQNVSSFFSTFIVPQ